MEVSDVFRVTRKGCDREGGSDELTVDDISIGSSACPGCCPIGVNVDILLKSVVKRRCRLARESLEG